jgi:hypothetical protein
LLDELIPYVDCNISQYLLLKEGWTCNGRSFLWVVQRTHVITLNKPDVFGLLGFIEVAVIIFLKELKGQSPSQNLYL